MKTNAVHFLRPKTTAIHKNLLTVLLGQKMPLRISESDLMQETGMTSLQLVTAMVRLRTDGLAVWEWVGGEGAYHVTEVWGQ